MLKEEKLLKAMLKNKLTLSIAESCTGGLLSHRITNIPGSSKVFLLGITAYSNEFKNKILKVPLKVIREKGAVSAEVVKAMAEGIRALAQASLGIGITGVAGPDGGTKEKPVGTVFIGLSTNKETFVSKFNFSGNRLEIKRKSTEKALEIILDFLAGHH